MKLKPQLVGTRRFDDRPVTVTDPCYDAGTWCTIHGLNVKPGEYNCVAWRGREYYKGVDRKLRSYSRIMICGIYLNGETDITAFHSMSYVGKIGVDAGLAGFFQDKPDYDDDAWDVLCDKVNNKGWLIPEEGFFTESGFGDGCYDVYGLKNKDGLYTALEIRFGGK